MVKVKTKKNLKTISFDEEIITKDNANKLVCEVERSNGIKKLDNIDHMEKENEKQGFENTTDEAELLKSKKIKRKKVGKQNSNFENEKNNNQNSHVETKTKHNKVKSETNEADKGNEDVEHMNETEGVKNSRVKRKKKQIANGEEIVQYLTVENEFNEEITDDKESERKVKRKKKKHVTGDETSEQSELPNSANIETNCTTESAEKKGKKKKKNKLSEEVVDPPEATEEVSVDNPKVKSGESIRAQKRKKHAKLQEEKRSKAEITSQQNVLNYLSKWKHCQSEWKFEKLKQIWLQQNMFDSTKIPNEFWDTVVEYFSGSKGFIRKVILRDAVKIIEKEEQNTEENTEENYLLILQRARDIVQNLQE